MTTRKMQSSSTSGQIRISFIPVTNCFETGFCNQIWIDERSAATNEQGEFEIAAVSGNFRFDILKDGYSEQRNMLLKMDGSVNEIQLQSGGAVGGTVTDSNGRPIRNFNIRVQIPRERHPEEKAGGYYAGFDWYGITFTRDDGTFVFTDVGADRWMRLIVSSPGVGRAILDRVKSQALDQLSPLDTTTIRLQPFVPLSVQVLDAHTKKPLPDALVTLLEDEPDFSGGFSWGHHDLWATRAHSNAMGTAVFAEPACEDGTVIVSAPGFARRRIAWTDGSEKMTVELEPAAILSGEVRLRDRLVKEGFVRLTSQNKDYYSINLADENGRFEFGQLPAGDYELTVTNSNGRRLHFELLTLKLKETKSTKINISGSLDGEGAGRRKQ